MFMKNLANGKYRRINRYIMECKSKRRKIITLSFNELIDTLWNVNEMKTLNEKVED